jgi:hypothetical protein
VKQFRSSLQPGITRGSLYSVIVLFIAMIVLTGASYALESNTISRIQRNTASIDAKTRAWCQFGADLAGAPVAVNPATGKPSILGVKIISDSRMAWAALDCPGHLAAPAPSFVKWARYYHLPVGG